MKVFVSGCLVVYYSDVYMCVCVNVLKKGISIDDDVVFMF